MCRICTYLYLFIYGSVLPVALLPSAVRPPVIVVPSIRCDIGRPGLVYGPGQKESLGPLSAVGTALHSTPQPPAEMRK